MTSPITLPPGQEIISPDIAKLNPEGMRYCAKGQPCDSWGKWTNSTPPTEDELEYWSFSAPLGTLAALSTPLPEARCECALAHNRNIEVEYRHLQQHAQSCPAHPRNRLVRVLPGQLAGLKVKPKGLIWAEMGKSNWEPFPHSIEEYHKTFAPGSVPQEDDGPYDLAYALPQWSYDAALGRGEEQQICSVGIIPTQENSGCATTKPPAGVEAASNPFPAPETSEPFRAAATPSAEEMLDWLEQFKMLEAYQNVAPMSLNFGKWEFRYWKHDCWSKLYIAPILRLAIASAMKEGK